MSKRSRSRIPSPTAQSRKKSRKTPSRTPLQIENEEIYVSQRLKTPVYMPRRHEIDWMTGKDDDEIFGSSSQREKDRHYADVLHKLGLPTKGERRLAEAVRKREEAEARLAAFDKKLSKSKSKTRKSPCQGLGCLIMGGRTRKKKRKSKRRKSKVKRRRKSKRRKSKVKRRRKRRKTKKH